VQPELILHVADLSIEQFLSQRDRFVELLKGDYFFGTGDVSMTAKTAGAMFQHGILGWLDAMPDKATGRAANSDFQQLATECDSLRDSCARAYFPRRFHEWRCQMGSRRISPK
jgi:hypothetical protein